MNHKTWPVAKDAFPFAIPLAALTVAFYVLFSHFLWVLPCALTLFVLYFFRNPKREGKGGEKEFLSPADGKVMSVTEIPDEAEFIGGPAVKVSIFLNIFNVHINRSPVDGTVGHVRYREGKFIPAFKSHASDINERNYLGIVTGQDQQRLLLVQIVGLVARRIVCWSEAGDLLE